MSDGSKDNLGMEYLVVMKRSKDAYTAVQAVTRRPRN